MFGIDMNRNFERTKLMTWQQHGDREERSQRCDTLGPGFGDSGDIHNDRKRGLKRVSFQHEKLKKKIRNWTSVISVHGHRY